MKIMHGSLALLRVWFLLYITYVANEAAANIDNAATILRGDKEVILQTLAQKKNEVFYFVFSVNHGRPKTPNSSSPSIQ